MGQAKASVTLGGRPLIDYPLAAAREAGLEAVVVAKRGSRLPQLQCEVVFEPDLPRHPLCGIVAALQRAAPADAIVTACDMPFVTAAMLRWLADLDGAAMAELHGRAQPLLARYAAASLAALRAALGEQASTQAAAELAAPRRVDERELRRFGDPQLLCFNVNDAGDLEVARHRLAQAR